MKIFGTESLTFELSCYSGSNTVISGVHHVLQSPEKGKLRVIRYSLCKEKVNVQVLSAVVNSILCCSWV